MARHRTPSFIGSPSNTSASAGSRGQYYNRFQELEDEEMEYEDENPPPSTRGVTPPREPETTHGDTSVMRPPGPPLQQDNFVSPGAHRGIVALKPADPFDCLPPKKCKAHMEVFSAFTGQPRGNDPMHVKLC